MSAFKEANFDAFIASNRALNEYLNTVEMDMFRQVAPFGSKKIRARIRYYCQDKFKPPVNSRHYINNILVELLDKIAPPKEDDYY